MMVIYKILSLSCPEKLYIGSAVDFLDRQRTHLIALRTHKHKNRKVQSHFDKYGENDLVFEIVEEVVLKENLLAREQHYLDTLNPTFNICKVANSSLGVKRTEEYKRKMSLSKKGKPHRPECKAEKSARQKGWQQALGFKHTEEAKRNISLNHGRKRAVDQFSLTGEFIKHWDYTKQASDATGVNKVSINANCFGKLKKAGGFIWKYSIT